MDARQGPSNRKLPIRMLAAFTFFSAVFLFSSGASAELQIDSLEHALELDDKSLAVIQGKGSDAIVTKASGGNQVILWDEPGKKKSRATYNHPHSQQMPKTTLSR